MRFPRLQKRLPAIAASVGLSSVLAISGDALDRPVLSLVLAVLLAVAAIFTARMELVGVTIAATLALATLSSTTEAFVVAGGSAVIALGLFAAAERRFRTSTFAIAAGTVAVLALAAPLTIEPPPDTLANYAESAPPIEVNPGIEQDAFPIEIFEQVEARPASDDFLLVNPTMTLDSPDPNSDVALVAEQKFSWLSFLLSLAGLAFLIWLIRRSIVGLSGPQPEAQRPDPDKFVAELDSIGRELGTKRRPNESLLAYGDRITAESGNTDFAEAASKISEWLYDTNAKVDTDALQDVLDKLKESAAQPEA